MKSRLYLACAVLIIVFAGCQSILDPKEDGYSISFDLAPSLIDPANTKVLIVGVLIYDDPMLGNFDTYHRKDSELAAALSAYGVPDSNIILLQDEDATRNAICKTLHRIAKNSNENTDFIFYFAGHGFNGWNEDESGIYFANSDISYAHPDETGFNLNFFTEQFLPLFEGNSILLMGDCCKSGGLNAIAETFGATGKQAVALSSCYYTDWSTGNWTFTQKVIDAIQGDGLIDADADGSITLNDMIDGITQGLKYVDRQRPDCTMYNCSGDAFISDVSTPYPSFEDPEVALGDYVFVYRKHNWFPTEINAKSGDTYTGRRYNFADYEYYTFTAEDIKIPYFVHYPVGMDILYNAYTDKPGTIIGADGDFMQMQSTEGGQILWRPYEAIISGTEITASILNGDGIWTSGQVLDSLDGNYFVHYAGKNVQYDEWITPDRVAF